MKADICDFKYVEKNLKKYKIDSVINLAAESHVDKYIKDPFTFARTNVMGTLSLLQACKNYWNNDFNNKLLTMPISHACTELAYTGIAHKSCGL